MPQTLSIAVCISDDVTLSDFITPVELFASLNQADDPLFGAAMGEVPYRVTIDYVAPTMEPVKAISGSAAPTLNPTMTYADALATGKQFDILWVPAGTLAPVSSSAPSTTTTIIFHRPPHRLHHGREAYSKGRDRIHRAAGAERQVHHVRLRRCLSARVCWGSRGETGHDKQGNVQVHCSTLILGLSSLLALLASFFF
jgi:hypothetical protein